MEISEVRVKLTDHIGDKLKAFCSITFDDCFVIKDLKIIEGEKGVFVAMPSRKITDHCVKCGSKNSVLGKFCSECGHKLEHSSTNISQRSRAYADIAHPITVEMRDMIHNAVLGGYKKEIEHSKQLNYKPVGIDESNRSSEIRMQA